MIQRGPSLAGSALAASGGRDPCPPQLEPADRHRPLPPRRPLADRAGRGRAPDAGGPGLPRPRRGLPADRRAADPASRRRVRGPNPRAAKGARRFHGALRAGDARAGRGHRRAGLVSRRRRIRRPRARRSGAAGSADDRPASGRHDCASRDGGGAAREGRRRGRASDRRPSGQRSEGPLRGVAFQLARVGPLAREVRGPPVAAGRRAAAVPADPAAYGSIDVSVEPDDGNSAHSGRSVLRGPL